MDVFRNPWIRRIAKSRWFPLAPQIVTLGVFVLLAAGGFGVTTKDAGFTKVLRNTNLADLILWSYWWPLIIIASLDACARATSIPRP